MLVNAAACPNRTGKKYLLKAQRHSKLTGREAYDLITNRVVYDLPLSGAPPHQPSGAHTRYC